MQRATSIFYGLSIFVLMTAFFAMQPSKIPEVASLQTQIKQQFSTAWQQTIGDQPYFGGLADVYDGINVFYDESSKVLASLILQQDSDQAIIYVFSHSYGDFAAIFQNKGHVAGSEIVLPDPQHFMVEPAIYNLVPEKQNPEQVLGANIDSEPVNGINQWVTLRDNFTGQLYCLAVYNGEVNKYLGACKNNNYH
jgi:hypothetical protein